MKNQMVTLVIGILIGAIIATGVFLVLKDDNKGKNNNFPNMGDRGSISERRKDFDRNSDSKSDSKTESTEKTEGGTIFKLIKRKIPITIFIIVVGVSCFFIGKNIGLNTDTTSSNKTIEDVEVSKQTITKTLTSTGSIEGYYTKSLSLNTDYYFDSLCVEEDDIVKKGSKLVKYTNGKYLTAPYDLVVSKISVPDTGKQASSKHYIQVQRTDKLKVSIDISESEISNIKVGTEVSVVLNADSSKKYTGKVIKISSVGTYSSSGSTFNVEVAINNDGNIKIGMSVSCTINIEERKDVIAVPVNAVQINGDRRYVVVVNGDKTEEVDVTTGLSNDEYVEIKSGLNGGEKVRVVTITKQSTIRNSSKRSSNNGMPGGGSFTGGGNMPSGNFPSRSSSSSGSSRPSF